MQNENRLLTAREASELLSVCERTLWGMTKRGDVPSIKIGSRGVRYPKQALLDWIKANTIHNQV